MMHRINLKEICDKVTGSFSILSDRYGRIFIKGSSEDRVNKEKKNIRNTYILVSLCFILLLSGFIAGRITEKSGYAFENGNVISILRPEDTSESKELEILIQGKDGIEKRPVTLNISPIYDGEDEKELEEQEEPQEVGIDELLSQMVREIEEDPSRKVIQLPTSLTPDIHIQWKMKNSCIWVFLVVSFIMMLVLIYFSRFDKVKKEEKKARDNIIMELPRFINKCVLLLNGGLVLTDALERIISESRVDRNNYFYAQLSFMLENSRQTNTPMEMQLSEYAINTGVQEFIRVSSIMYDNVKKGTSLVEKLEAESNALWFKRKKKAEELGKLAETRLTMPLVVLLLVLITVTVAPALMEM